MEIKLAPDNPNIVLSFKSRVLEVAQPIFQVSKCRLNQLVPQFKTSYHFQVYDAILHN